MHWNTIREGFLFGLATHVPYLEEADREGLLRDKSACYIFFTRHVMNPAIAGLEEFAARLQSAPARGLVAHWETISQPKQLATLGEQF